MSLLAIGQRDCGQLGLETQGEDEHHRAMARAAMSEKESPFPVMAVSLPLKLSPLSLVPTKHFDTMCKCLLPGFKQSKLYYLKLMRRGILGIPGTPMFHSHFKRKTESNPCSC